MAGSKFSQRLGTMKRKWKSSQKRAEQMFGGAKVEEGEYVARLTKAFIKESSQGNLFIRREHTIIDGEYTGVIIYDNMMLETDLGPAFIRRWIDTLGYNQPEEPEELEDFCDAAVKDAPTCHVRVRHSGDFVNVDVLKVVDSGEEPETTISTTPAQRIVEKEKTEPQQKEKKEEKKEEKEEEEEPTNSPPSAGDELLTRLFEFARGADIDTEEDDTVDVLVERIKEDMGKFDYEYKKMATDEVELIEGIGLGDFIMNRPEKKKRGRKPSKKSEQVEG